MRGMIAIGAAVAALSFGTATAGSVTLADWPAYLNGPLHTSVTTADTVTPANVGSLHLAWHFKPPVSTMPGQPPPQVFASPTVVGNRVYVGFNNGVFYALDAD